MDKGITKDSNYLANQSPRVWYKNLGLFTTLGLLFILLAGHDSVNPRLGDESDIDFYLDETSHLLEINAKAYLLNANLLDNSFDNSLKDLSLQFYKDRNFSPAWTLNLKRSDNLSELIRLVDSATYFGFPASILNSDRLMELLDEMEKGAFNENSLGKRIDLEIEATRTALQYMIFLNKGIVLSDTSKLFSEFASETTASLNAAIASKSLAENILSQQPTMTVYKNLTSGLAKLVAVKDLIASSVAAVPNTILAEAFYYTGYLNAPSFDSINKIENTIKYFQKSCAQDTTGQLTRGTLNELSSKLYDRYLLAAINIDRIRKINSNSKNYILVNIPEYKLHVFNNQVDKKQFNVVVGTTKTPTPILSSYLEKIITNPYWTVPRSIIVNEMLPKIRKDSTYLKRNGYFIINGREERVDEALIDWNNDNPLGSKYWIRQKNGRGNALGTIKFIFPNESSVYLHDTPSKRYFKKETRAYSHGCIRVENPENLAQYLVDTYQYNEKKPININERIKSKNRIVIPFDSEIEVHLQYLTCMPDDNNQLVFYKDVYNYDTESMKLLGQTTRVSRN